MISLLFIILAGIFKAVMDKLLFHYSKSIFSNLNQQYWNPKLSCNNKWKNGNEHEGERFFGSSTFFVLFTDAWHLFQHFNIFCLITAIVTYTGLVNIFIDFALYYFLYTVSFEITFKHLLKHREYVNKKALGIFAFILILITIFGCVKEVPVKLLGINENKAVFIEVDSNDVYGNFIEKKYKQGIIDTLMINDYYIIKTITIKK